MKNKIILYILIFVFPLLICFSSCFVNSNAQALETYTLDSSSLQVLNGGSSSAYSSVNYYGMNDPTGLVALGAGNQIYEDINQKLYDSTGWDIESAAWYWDDNLNSNTIVQNLTKNAISSINDAISQGFYILSTAVPVAYIQAKNYILGKIDSTTGKITDVYNNVYTYISSDYKNNLKDVKTELQNEGDIVNLSSQKVYYDKNLYFGSNWDFNIYSVNFNRPFVYYNMGLSTGSSSVKNIGIIYPYDYVINDYFKDGFGIGTSGTRYNFSGVTVQEFGNIYINGVRYRYGYLKINFNNNSSFVTSLQPPDFTLDQAQAFIGSYDPYGQELVYEYTTSDSQQLSLTLNLLNDKWVTSDDLRQINEKLDNLTLGNIVINGNTTPVIDTDSDSLSELSTLIQQILNRNADINNGDMPLPEPEPEPDPEPVPEPYNEQGISIPENFNSDIVDNTFSVFELPFSFVSIFEPLFYLFGAFSGMFAIFSFIPFIIIGILIIWALK